jgi:hypothetical protein
MSELKEPERLYRISSVAKILDVTPLTARRYLDKYGIEVRATAGGLRVTHTELTRFVNLFYGRPIDTTSEEI